MNINIKKLLIKKLFIKILYSTFLFFTPLYFLSAQVIDSKFYDWTVYEFQNNEFDYKKCYIVSHPISSDSDDSSRKKPYLMITRYQKDRKEEVSVYGGFEFKTSSEIFMIVDAFQFYLKAKDDMAWAISKTEDIAIIETLINSKNAKIRSDSALGSYAIDDYSLKGITLAYNRMREICR